jgi:hypothetical protein
MEAKWLVGVFPVGHAIDYKGLYTTTYLTLQKHLASLLSPWVSMHSQVNKE